VLGAQSGHLHPWLGGDVSDSETNDYLLALSPDLEPLRLGVLEADVPISVVKESPVEQGRTVPPFLGARLHEWAARCLASPYGFLHTRVSDWRTTTLRTAEGELIEVAEIGCMSPDPENVGGSVLDWLTAQARDRGIETQPGCSLHRIVFEEGEVVGAVLTTPGGPLAIRTRHGVTVATGGPTNAAPPQQPSEADGALRVCLVSRHASRFGRLELLTSESFVQKAPSICMPDNRQLRANLRDTQAESPVWRCARGDGYPPIGQ
jgi:FAD binding domain-containing protein